MHVTFEKLNRNVYPDNTDNPQSSLRTKFSRDPMKTSLFVPMRSVDSLE